MSCGPPGEERGGAGWGGGRGACHINTASQATCHDDAEKHSMGQSQGAEPDFSSPKSQGTSATGQVGFGQGKPTGRGRSSAVTPATTAHHCFKSLLISVFRV